MLARRGLFMGAASLLAAPSIVRAANLMPVRQHRVIAQKYVVLTMDFVFPDGHSEQIAYLSFPENMAKYAMDAAKWDMGMFPKRHFAPGVVSVKSPFERIGES